MWAVIALVVVGGLAFVTQRRPAAVAVLPFENRSAEKENEFFTDGVHDNILTSLTNIGQLQVVSRTSVMEYRGTKKKIPQIARELNVAYVLYGSVQRDGRSVRITGQLIRAATDEHIWAKNFDRELSTAGIFAIQSELAQAIAGELKAAISPSERKLIERRPTENLAAYDLYLKARDVPFERREAWDSRESFLKKEALLGAAVELDPKFAAAWAELSRTHARFVVGKIDTTPERRAKVKAALERALEFDPDSPEVIRALIFYHFWITNDRARGIAELERLLRVAPNDAEGYSTLGGLQVGEGKFVEALANVEKAMRLDPRSLSVAGDVEFLMWRGRRYAEATQAMRRQSSLWTEDLKEEVRFGRVAFQADGSTRKMEELAARIETKSPGSADAVRLRQTIALWRGDLEEAIRIDRLNPMPADAKPGNAPGLVNGDGVGDMALVYLFKGDRDAARKRLGNFPAFLRADLDREPDNTRLIRYLATVEAILGNKESAVRLAERSVELATGGPIASGRQNAREVLAQVCAIVGEKDRAIAELTHLLRTPSQVNIHELKVMPAYFNLRGDARFEALVDDPKNNAPLF